MSNWQLAGLALFWVTWLGASWWLNWDHRRRWKAMYDAHAERMEKIMGGGA